ncbi:MAG: hypothetical protein ACFFCW_26670 [Candidatus Hodarchaeota archaeon]
MNSAKLSKLGKICVALIIAIVAGAIGSGVWIHIFGPLIYWSRDKILTVTTLGIQAFKDSTYQQIASGFHESASDTLLFDFRYLLMMVFILVTLHLIVRGREIRRRIQKDIDQLEKTEEEKKPSLEDLHEKFSLAHTRSNRIVKRGYILFMFAIIWSMVFMISTIRLRYINSAISHFQQVLTICSPYLEPGKEKQVISSFAQIRSQKEYVNLLDDLKKIATTNKLYLPKFNIW